MPEQRASGSPPEASAQEAPSFEVALAELEDIVKTLEAGRGTLADAIHSYTRGAQLRQQCERHLTEAEMRVQAILDTPGGPTLRDVE